MPSIERRQADGPVLQMGATRERRVQAPQSRGGRQKARDVGALQRRNEVAELRVSGSGDLSSASPADRAGALKAETRADARGL